MAENGNMSLFLDAIRMEHWARFHCMHELAQDEKNLLQNMEETFANTDMHGNPVQHAKIFLSAELLSSTGKDYPTLAPLLALIQNTRIDLDSTRDHILVFFRGYFFDTHVSGTDEEKEVALQKEVERISASKKFARYLDVFYTFVQEEADAEDTLLMQKEEELSEEDFAKYLESIPVPTFKEWDAKFHEWAEKRNFRLEVE